MIVIPMAGLSKRFLDAGYSKPKYMLPLNGRSVFSHAVSSFSAYFAAEPFLFIARDIDGTVNFINDECTKLGISNATVAALTAPTAGQAETVELGLQQAGVADTTALTIFNIDTFRPEFRFPEAAWWTHSDGYLEVFRGQGANWSYVRPATGAEPLVLETAEKRPISDLCCSGLYHFARTADFLAALQEERASPSSSELYVAPLYNYLIRRGMRVHWQLIKSGDVIFCGIPAEYRQLLNLPAPK